MSTDLYGVRVLARTPEHVDVRVFQTYYDGVVCTLPDAEIPTFFLRILWDAGDARFGGGGPIGHAIHVAQILSERYVGLHARRFIRAVTELRRQDTPPPETQGSMRFYYERDGQWKDEDLLIQADYRIVPTDPRWIEHLQPGQSWGTTSYETPEVTDGWEVEITGLTPLDFDAALAALTARGHDPRQVKLVLPTGPCVALDLTLRALGHDQPFLGEAPFVCSLVRELWTRDLEPNDRVDAIPWPWGRRGPGPHDRPAPLELKALLTCASVEDPGPGTARLRLTLPSDWLEPSAKVGVRWVPYTVPPRLDRGGEQPAELYLGLFPPAPDLRFSRPQVWTPVIHPQDWGTRYEALALSADGALLAVQVSDGRVALLDTGEGVDWWVSERPIDGEGEAGLAHAGDTCRWSVNTDQARGRTWLDEPLATWIGRVLCAGPDDQAVMLQRNMFELWGRDQIIRPLVPLDPQRRPEDDDDETWVPLPSVLAGAAAWTADRQTVAVGWLQTDPPSEGLRAVVAVTGPGGERRWVAAEQGGMYRLSVALDPAGRWLATALGTPEVALWDPESGARLGALGGLTVPALGLATSPDGRFLLVGAENGAWIWSTQDWTAPRRCLLMPGLGAVREAIWGGGRLYLLGYNAVVVWDVT